MTKIYKFMVYINGLEDKIYREIEIPSSRKVSDLAYSILASFDSLAYHLYNLNIDNVQYDCGINLDMTLDYFKNLTSDELSLYHNNVIIKEACKTNLEDVDFHVNKTFEMQYDMGSTTTFIIKFVEKKELVRYTHNKYPLITSGAGAGMLDDISDEELLDVVNKTDKLGYSEFYYTPGYDIDKIFDYRNFDLKNNQLKVRRFYAIFKNKYEDIFEE